MLYACMYQHQPPPPLIKERRRKKSDATQPLPPAVAFSPRLSRARRTQTGQHATKTKNKTPAPGIGLHLRIQSNHSSPTAGPRARPAIPLPRSGANRTKPTVTVRACGVVWLSPRGSIRVWPLVAFAEPRADARRGRQAPLAQHAHARGHGNRAGRGAGYYSHRQGRRGSSQQCSTGRRPGTAPPPHGDLRALGSFQFWLPCCACAGAGRSRRGLAVRE